MELADLVPMSPKEHRRLATNPVAARERAEAVFALHQRGHTKKELASALGVTRQAVYLLLLRWSPERVARRAAKREKQNV